MPRARLVACRRFCAAVVLTTVALASGCDWLTGPKLSTDPNRPTDVTRDQLLVGVQSRQFSNLEQQLDVSLWMQQLTDVGQFNLADQLYEFIPSFWFQTYASGGLVDVRKIQASAREAHDQKYLGVAQTWEALIIGQTADMFGDIPYSQAVAGIATPKLDSQAVVYESLQRLLDSTITNLESGQGPGPATVDLVYHGDTRKWALAAHSLKARLFLHTAERNPAAYGAALAEAQLGIDSSNGDFLTWHGEKPGEENSWFSISVDGNFSTETAAGKTFIDIMKSRDDPRLPQYFTLAGDGQYAGAAPGDGFDATTQSRINGTRGARGFRQPVLTWAETRLIEAEALYRAHRESEARAALNVERQAAGLPAISASGSDLLVQILQEKYIALFQSPEVWNDYKRTCYPNLVPVSPALGGNIPVRYHYDERAENPNIPADPTRNWNDPVTPFAPDGSPCLGQKF